MTLLLAATAAAQVSKVSATLEGTLADSSGAVIPSAEIKLRNIETNQTRTVKTDEQGFFRASELVVGTYEVRVEQPGFAPYRHTGVVLSIGQITRLNIDLAPGATTDAITVTDQPPVIDPSQPTFTTTIETEKIEELPVRSRNYLNLAIFAHPLEKVKVLLPITLIRGLPHLPATLCSSKPDRYSEPLTHQYQPPTLFG